MDVSFASAVVILLLVADPLGNIPLFLSLMRHVEQRRRARVIVRECLIAFVVLLAFAFFGSALFDLLGISYRSLNIAGGVILFLIAVKMIFHDPDQAIFGDAPSDEPFIVPLAIPSIAGPAAIATVILLVSRAPERILEWIGALALALLAMLVTLLFADRIARRLGERGLLAFERLMGLILTAIAVEMSLRGIEDFVHQLSR